MFRKQFLAPTILSLACVLLIADAAHAQRRGIFGGRRGGSGVTVGPVDSYSPSYSYSDYYTPSQQYNPQQQGPMDDNIARIRVIVSDPQARVFFDGAPTQQTGTERLFYTPPLQATATNTYRIRATWNQGGKETMQERVINVTPGRMTVIDFTQQQGEQIPRGPQQPQPLPQDTILEGKILRTGQDQFVIQTRDKREVTVFTNPETRYLLNNDPAVFTDLRTGTSVNVNFRMDGKRHIGNTITIRP
jgi:uncharacterized protein (TIGR03000 family)